MKTDAVEPTSKPRHPVSAYPRWLYIRRWLLRHIIGEIILARIMWKFTVNGTENIPRSGPTLLVFNHVTLFDPLAAGIATGIREVTPLGKQELADNPITNLAFRAWGTITIKRGEVDRTALKASIAILEHTNDMLLISPEGHRQKHGMRDPKEGVVLLATHTNAQIMPVGVTGTENFVNNLKHFRRTPITVNIGRPFSVREGVTRKQYTQTVNEIMYQIAPLIAPHLRGEYADLSKATMDTLAYS
ncbi:MAG: 1-acyl-sn-glycerol-3-phosphate acyltransferase [Anaerolineae bacterium]|nr:1-acyl-sn-glycerol-3-phosphate acyltransferase [Anaerolineae bacterium]